MKIKRNIHCKIIIFEKTNFPNSTMTRLTKYKSVLLQLATELISIFRRKTLLWRTGLFVSATATVSVAKPRLIGENDQPLNLSPENETDDFWHTSVGKFRFNIEDLPEQLQYIHKLLKVWHLI